MLWPQEIAASRRRFWFGFPRERSKESLANEFAEKKSSFVLIE
jgi:hypothetical protein